MNWPNWLRQIFAPEPLRVERPRFVENPFIGQISIDPPAERTSPHLERKRAQAKRNFALNAEQLSARSRKSAATKAKNKARVEGKGALRTATALCIASIKGPAQ